MKFTDAQGSGLAKLLADRDITLKGIEDTTMARLGDALGLARFFEPSLRVLEDVRANFGAAASLLGADAPDGLGVVRRHRDHWPAVTPWPPRASTPSPSTGSAS